MPPRGPARPLAWSGRGGHVKAPPPLHADRPGTRPLVRRGPRRCRDTSGRSAAAAAGRAGGRAAGGASPGARDRRRSTEYVGCFFWMNRRVRPPGAPHVAIAPRLWWVAARSPVLILHASSCQGRGLGRRSRGAPPVGQLLRGGSMAVAPPSPCSRHQRPTFAPPRSSCTPRNRMPDSHSTVGNRRYGARAHGGGVGAGRSGEGGGGNHCPRRARSRARRAGGTCRLAGPRPLPSRVGRATASLPSPLAPGGSCGYYEGGLPDQGPFRGCVASQPGALRGGAARETWTSRLCQARWGSAVSTPKEGACSFFTARIPAAARTPRAAVSLGHRRRRCAVTRPAADGRRVHIRTVCLGVHIHPPNPPPTSPHHPTATTADRVARTAPYASDRGSRSVRAADTPWWMLCDGRCGAFPY